jgi:hypothetical protein
MVGVGDRGWVTDPQDGQVMGEGAKWYGWQGFPRADNHKWPLPCTANPLPYRNRDPDTFRREGLKFLKVKQFIWR